MLSDRRSTRRWPRAVLLVAVLAAMSGCGGDDRGVDPVGAAGYTAVIDDLLPPVPVDGSRPVVYIARLGEDPFALEDQIEMIAAVEQNYDLRFVDDMTAAVDNEDSDASPRDDGHLFGIGTISATVPHVVRVEVYRAAGVVEAHRLTLTLRDDVWRVDASEPVDPEVLVHDD